MIDEPEIDPVQKRMAEDEPFRERLCDWLRLNGIDPNHVPAYERPSFADGNLTLRMMLLDDKGKSRLGPDGRGPLTHTVTTPVEVPPTGDVLEWLVPRCPTCGR